MKFIIPGTPQPLARHRDFRKGNVTIHYDPSKKYKMQVANCIRQQLDSLKQSQLAQVESLYVKMTFYFPTNASDSNAVTNAKLWGLIDHNIKPDSTNIFKLYEDAANGILYRDDCMIVKGCFEKKYSENPRTEIEIFMKKKEISDMSCEVLKMMSPNQLTEFFDDVRKLGEKSYPCASESDQWGPETSADSIKLFAVKYGDLLSKIKKKSSQQKLGESNAS